ncbi:MAG: hypothetical protein WC443_08965 [Desulfobaccales bacterium]
MTRITWRRELAWAIGLLGLAVILGFMFHWPLAQASLRGNLTTLLDQKRQERREVQFQGVRTLDLAQAYQIWQEKRGPASLLEDGLFLLLTGWLYRRERRLKFD